MAKKIAVQTGLYSAAATWGGITNTPTLHATTNITMANGTYYTVAYTAPDLVNSATGLLLHCVAVGTGGTLTVTLQENSAGWVDVAGATVTINTTALKANDWIWFAYGTPYVFASLTAGYYRIKIVAASMTGTTTMAADTAGTAVSYMATDSITGVPTAEDIIILSKNQTGTITVTMDGTQTCGVGTDTGLVVRRSIGQAISIYKGGVLTWDITVDSTLTCTGNIVVDLGELSIGTLTDPYTAGKTGKLLFAMAATGNHGIGIFDANVNFCGNPLNYYKANYVSGVGTAASPLVVDEPSIPMFDANWQVNDELVIAASSNNAANYNETEYKFIKTVVAPNTYILSATIGGAESGLTYTHPNAVIGNLTRNVVLDSTDVAKYYYGFNSNTVATKTNMSWARLNRADSNTTNKTAWYVQGYIDVNYCVFDVSINYVFVITSPAPNNYIGCIFVRNGLFCVLFGNANARGQNFTDCYFIDVQRNGLLGSFGYTSTWTRCVFIACNRTSATNYGAINFDNGASVHTFIDCEFHCSRVSIFTLSNCGTINIYRGLFGTKGKNLIDIQCQTDKLIGATFYDSVFNSNTLINNYMAMLSGSKIAFHNYQQIANNHRWYTNLGCAQSCGAGLTDTTVRTASSLALRLSPENSAIGFSWSFKILAKANSAVSALGFIQKSVDFTSETCIVELFLPGSLTADFTQTMPNDVLWNPFVVYANYTGAVDLYATVKITAKTTIAAAYVYVDDIFNGTNKITALDVWDNGEPSPIMFEQLGDAAAVWAVATTTLTTAGTTGKRLVDALSTTKFIGLK